MASAGPGTAALQAVGNIALQAEGKLGDIRTVVFIIGALCLYLSFYCTRLIPRWLSVWGLISTLPYLSYYILHFFDIETDLMFLVIPLAVQEMAMGLWLLARGFSPEAIRRLDGNR